MIHGLRFVVSLGAMALCFARVTVVPAFAEQRDPVLASFGRAPDTTRPLSLLNLSVYSGAGEDPGGETSGSNAAASVYSGFDGSFGFTRRSSRGTFTAGLGTGIRFYPTSRQILTLDRTARVGIDTRLGATSEFRASQTFQFTPFRQFGLIGLGSSTADELPPSRVDGASAVGNASYDLATSIELSRRLRRQGGLAVAYSARQNIYPASTERFSTQRIGVGFKYGLGRHAALLLGTAYRFGQSGVVTTPGSARSQDFDIGIDYNRPLTFARNTTISFKTGTALVSRTRHGADDTESGRRFRMIGSVTAVRTIGRDWEARVAYDRNLQFIEGFADPFYANGVMGRVSGQIGGRVSARMQADYATGKAMDFDPSAIAKRFRGLQTRVRVNYALTRHWQLYADHYYSENHLSAAAELSLPPGVVPRRFGRGLRFGFSLWAPVVH